jgi:hypothetical protein
MDVLCRQKYLANYYESLSSTVDATVGHGIPGVKSDLTFSVREIAKGTVATFTIWPKNISPLKGLKIYMTDYIIGKNLFDNLSLGIVTCT